MRATQILCLAVLLTTVVAAPASGQTELKSADSLEVEASLDELERTEEELERALQQVWARKYLLQQRAAGEEGGFRGDEEDQVRIVNGVLTWEFPTTGALLKGASLASASSHCTGTLIGCRTFLTANHCVERDRDPDQYFVYLQQGGIFPVEAISEEHPEYLFPHADYAVVRLGTAVEGITPTPLNREVVAAGTRGQIIGFGRSGGLRQDYGLKRAGRVQTAECDRPEDSLLCWDFSAPVGLPGEDSNTCNADSGGPLFVDRVDGPVVAGITSGGSRSSCLAGDHSYDVDVRQFLDEIETFARDDLDLETCGDLPVVGSADAQIFGDSRELGAGGFQEYRIELPPDLARLRLALNGQDEFTTDFDLFVNHGSVASPGDSDCEQSGPGNYAFCELAEPEAGTWFIRVRQNGSGSGSFQLVATVFRGAS